MSNDVSYNNFLRPEILAPAGNIEKLIFACKYGADAVYVGGGSYSLRSGSGFSIEDLYKARKITNELNKKLYVAINIFAHNEDIDSMEAYLHEIKSVHPDALLVSDPGVFDLCQQIVPEIPLHISTQANNTNYRSAQFWKKQGASRIVLSRELSLDNIRRISNEGGLETEIFVHGAICISYSGRCLISNYLTGRSANLGSCTHPCRWKYVLMEEKRPGEYLPIEEDEHGTYIMNSADMCLIDLVPELVKAGITSWKIEGRNKSAYYVANIVRIYKAALDAFFENPQAYTCNEKWLEELSKVSNRTFTTGFATGKPNAQAYRYDSGDYVRTHDFAAIALGVENNRLLLEQRNHFTVGDVLEVLLPDGNNLALSVQDIKDTDGNNMDAARHPYQKITIPYDCKQHNFNWPLICRRAVR